MILHKKNNYVYYEDGDNKFWIHESELDFKDKGSNIVLISARPTWAHQGQFEWVGNVNLVEDRFGVNYGATTLADLIYKFQGPLDTMWTDQTTDPVIVKFNIVHASTTIAVEPTVGDYDITVTSSAGAVVGNKMVFFHPILLRFTFAEILNVAANVITIDSPIDVAYPVGTYVDFATTNMNVDGSGTAVTFGLRGTGAPPGVDLDVDITRIIFKCTTEAAVDLSKFADIAGGLTRGLLIRQRAAGGRHQNILNVKTNGDLAGVMYDWTPFDAQNLNQGQHGFVARLTFAGPDKIGVAIRLPVGTDLECLVQDALQTITEFEIMAEGHIVEP